MINYRKNSQKHGCGNQLAVKLSSSRGNEVTAAEDGPAWNPFKL